LTVIVDASFLVALLGQHGNHHRWAIEQARQHPRPWHTCDAVVAETFHLLGIQGWHQLMELLRRQSVLSSFSLVENLEAVLNLMAKDRDVPMSFADACWRG
jgi:uncharacterized protein